MPYIYVAVDGLQMKPKVGDLDCVALIRTFAPGLKVPSTKQWRPGARVIDTPDLKRGTAIATFDHGHYTNKETGQHAAFFLSHAGAGFWVMDQWSSNVRKPRISKRYIARGRALPSGSFDNASNNALAFFVIEL